MYHKDWGNVAMKTLHFYRELTPRSFESAIYGASATTKSAQGWTEESISDGIFIDLSKVEFSEFSALAQVAAFVEGAARHGVHVRIAMPRPKPRKGEMSFIENCRRSKDYKIQRLADKTEKIILNRKNALGFMHRCEFGEALIASHVPGSGKIISIDTDYDSGEDDSHDISIAKEGLEPETPVDRYEEEYQYSAIFPLKWHVPISGETLPKSTTFAASVVNFKEMGLTEPDARAIVGTVLGELIENVFHYAKEKTSIISEPYSLVGAIALNPAKYKMDSDWFRPCLKEFAEWANETNSLIIQLIVADSGVGIPFALGPYFGPQNEDELPSSEEFDTPLEPSEKILFWSFNRWSTSDKETMLLKRGTRGLWLVQRFVRAYQGAVTIRAEDAMVGWRYRSGDVSPIRDKTLRYVPGTFLNIYLLPQISATHKKPMAVHVSKERKLRFAVVRCQESDDWNICERDIEHLVSHLRKGGSIDHTCVIASLENNMVSSRTAQDLFTEALGITSGVVNPNALILLLPKITLRQIQDAVDSFNAFDQRPDQYGGRLGVGEVREPLLLIDSKGEWVWVGSCQSVRNLLLTLLRNEKTSKYEELIEELHSRNDPKLELRHWINDHPDLVQVTAESDIRLLFSMTDINESIIAYVRRALETGVHEGVGIVQKGAFRTPTLQYVNRWVNVEDFLRERTGIEVVAYALARKLEAGGYIYGKQNLSLVRIDTASAGVTASLKECLGIYNTIYHMPGDLDVFRQLEVPRVPRGTNVILCTDLILSGNTLRRAISELLHWDVGSVTVACVFDARMEKKNSIECMGRAFPVVSAAELEILIPDALWAREIRNIDPLLREPIYRSALRRIIDYEINPESELHQWCQEDEGTLCFGHIERSIGRHFTIYLNPRKLIQEGANHREEILGLFVQHILRWIEKRTTGGGEAEGEQEVAIEIWVPGDLPDFAGEFAKNIKQRMSVDYPNIPVAELKGIRRAGSGGKWVFPQEVKPLDQETHVIIVDWGSLTTATAHQMIRLASEAGAASIKAIIFLSQMTSEDEMILRGQPAVKGRRRLFNVAEKGNSIQKPLPFPILDLGEHAGEWEVREIPVEVVFLSSLRLSYFTPQECPICRVREAFVNEEEICPTELLREHANGMNELLKEREREDVFKHPQKDLYGAPITSQAIVGILRIRQQLENAIKSTEERYTILCDLKELNNGITDDRKKIDAINWVRLLATEPIWLKLPPLRFDELRQHTARIALNVIVGDGASDVDARIRQQGIIVLRAASSEIFIAEVSRIFVKCIGERDVLKQLLYDTFTSLLASYHESPHFFEKIIENLEKCQEFLQPHMDQYDSSMEYMETVSNLLKTARFLEANAGIKTIKTKEAWNLLKKEYVESMMLHYGAPRRIINVWIPFQEATESPVGYPIPDSERWKNALEAWEECHTFLLAKVVPYLRALRKIILGEFFMRQLTLEENAFIASFMKEGFPYPGSDLAALLYSFMNNPKSVLDIDKGEKFRDKYKLWYNLFLRVQRAGEEERLVSAPAKFFRLIHSCPCNLKKVVEAEVNEMQHSGYSFEIFNHDYNELDFQVFCPQELARDTISHVIENAAGEKHADPNRKKDKPSIYFQTPRMSGEDKLIITILNDGTRSSPKWGKGFQSLNRQLEDFGAFIKGADHDERWSYEVTIEFMRG